MKKNNKYTKLENLENLKNQIDEIRESLNEVCATFEKGENSEERLLLSRCLDKLIVEYMTKISNNFSKVNHME